MPSLRPLLHRVLPAPARQVIRKVVLRGRLGSAYKGAAEMAFWDQYAAGLGADGAAAPETEYYRKFMLAMGGVADPSFFDDRICLDIGCGPRGSMTWLTNARAAIGLDPLSEGYARFGIHTHRMTYLTAPAERMPLPSRYVDVVFSMNSLDHVDNLRKTCQEIRRVLRPGGHFIASLNLGEPATATEPWTLSESLLEELLFHGWERQFYKVRPKVEATGHFAAYRWFFEDPPPEALAAPGPRVLWCRFRVPEAAGNSTGPGR
jgi:SAM-dependent methyltransferase